MALGILGKLLAGGATSLIGGLLSRSKGKKGKYGQAPTLTPQQQAYQNQVLQSLQQLTPEAFQYLSGILSQDPEALRAYEAPAIRQFQRELLPLLGEEYGGKAGSQGALRSGAYDIAASQGLVDLSTNLAAQRASLQDQALARLQGFANIGQQQAGVPTYTPPTPGFGQRFGSALAEGGLGYGLQALQGLYNQPNTPNLTRSLRSPVAAPGRVPQAGVSYGF